MDSYRLQDYMQIHDQSIVHYFALLPDQNLHSIWTKLQFSKQAALSPVSRNLPLPLLLPSCPPPFNFSLFLPDKLLPAIWLTDPGKHSLLPWHSVGGPHAFPATTPTPLYATLRPFFYNRLLTRVAGLLNELNLAWFSPTNAVKHWRVSVLPGNSWGVYLIAL